jgi:hypothetical protein
MKSNSLVKWAGGSLLALSLAIMPSTLPASAQTGAPAGTAAPGTVTTVDTNDGFDWGWLGLLGLIGLAGLAGRNRDNTTTYTDRTTTTPASNNPRY